MKHSIYFTRYYFRPLKLKDFIEIKIFSKLISDNLKEIKKKHLLECIISNNTEELHFPPPSKYFPVESIDKSWFLELFELPNHESDVRFKLPCTRIQIYAN